MNGDRDSGRSRDHYSSRGDRDDRRDRDRDRRRRSRSPGHRSSRRDYEVDTYSSSRDYREREREDRYAGRERHRDDDRSWRRRDRRDDDERPPRRDRDLFDDRGGRGGRRDRDGFGGRERKRSASPPPKKKEPTPDLTDTVPILERRRRLTQWDIKPPGYENVTAEQAKLSGMFPLPGAPRQQPMDPSRLQAFMNQPAGSANASALKPSNARQSKRLFIYNIPASATEESVQEFFNLHLNGMNIVQGQDACVSAHIPKDRAFALLEFRTSEDTTLALALDGISMESGDETNGAANGDRAGLTIRRPKDYIVPAIADEADYQEGVVTNVVKDTPNKICVTHIPAYLSEEQVTELLTSFGELKAFVLVKDTSSEQSRGIAFCEYLDPTATDIAVEGLNGMELGEEHLKVGKASIGVQQASGLEMGVNAMSMLAGTSSDVEQGRVLQLLNMVTPEELMDNDEYEEIVEDVREECQKFGQVLDLKIPRPSGSRTNPGVGKIYVKYDTPESAQKALRALAGRKFDDRTVVVTFFGEEYFDVNAW
ncbi:uncharacterized protein K452DRAFT_241974 [Aplosporella prunicola CBS 121167]|uniref:Splicing factor U2AF subunit n=1 Tax=Aplosporella prunicola CBS 121167 TaxID=1176127 RepID=A0A6A6BU92_9PEZI|nr:uncharacterized protein K452DRAFT_241974 [Aplosporella prunicola CBS 121167]KAF2146835.1 hypothetical protein K452DRAFT_241974 [Aplosporella prunicola CBS 121167]